MAKPITPEQRAQILALHAAGHSCQSIARETGLSAQTVSKYAREAGRSFDRAKTKAANAANSADFKRRRLEHAGRALDLAEYVLERFPAKYRRVVKGVNGAELVDVDPAPEDLRQYAAAYALLVDKHLALDKHDRGDDHEEARSMADKLLEAFGLGDDVEYATSAPELPEQPSATDVDEHQADAGHDEMADHQ